MWPNSYAGRRRGGYDYEGQEPTASAGAGYLWTNAAARQIHKNAEGSVDRQSAHGKTVARVVAACTEVGVPCVVLGGRVSADAVAPLRALGAIEVRAIGPDERPLAESLAVAGAELATAAEAVVRGL